jgi:Cft2 family RNA processing exonuclease
MKGIQFLNGIIFSPDIGWIVTRIGILDLPSTNIHNAQEYGDEHSRIVILAQFGIDMRQDTGRFKFLVASDPTIPGKLQRSWGQSLENANLFMSLSGSHLGMMRCEFLSDRAPLFGRASARLHLMPLSFRLTCNRPLKTGVIIGYNTGYQAHRLRRTSMKITFLGGADEVGASSQLFEIAGRRILVDCGIRPSPRARGGLTGEQLPNLDQIKALDAILVTHAHADHTGGLELVVERFPDIPVYATAPTVTLTRVLHQDSRRIMQTRLEEEDELPLFDDVAVERLMSAFVPVPFHTPIALGENLTVSFIPAGHIAGAAMLGLESDEGRVLITGDLSISPQRTVDGAKPPAFQPDVLLLESTYGGRLHANRAVQERKLVEAVVKVTAEGGKVLIPAFALGRAQEVLLILGEFQRRGVLPVVPVWADGMVRAICQAYSSFAELLPLSLQERKAKFFEGSIRSVQTAEQRNTLIWEPGAAVIVASSGMLAGGPSLSYARSLAGSPQHAILLTGYQDEESPGRRLQEVAERGHGTIRLGKEKVDVQCHLGTYSLSAHADEGQLISLAETLNPEHVILVHGDEQARTSLEKAFSQRQRIVHLPYAGQTLEFHFDKPIGFPKSHRPEALRARWAAVNRQRRVRMSEFAGSIGKWLLLQGDEPTAALCLALEADHLWVEVSPGLEQAAYPEEVLAILGDRPPTEADLVPYRPTPAVSTLMEPNQALAFANQLFPTEARLRKVGYRLAEHVLVLAFDFPDAARQSQTQLIADLESATGWQVEVAAEANQAALNALVGEVLPEGWRVTKSPAIYRDEKRIAAVVSPVQDQDDSGRPEALQEACDLFQVVSGFELSLSVTEAAAGQAAPAYFPPAGTQMEINAAYGLIKSTLADSTLYRTSLKGEEIVLSFISPQIGERYQAQINALSRQTGWPMSINPNPNQGAILEAARSLLARAGWTVGKGLSVYPEKAEVIAALVDSPSEQETCELAAAFENLTSFRLTIKSPAKTKDLDARAATSDVVEIPLDRIRLRPHQQSLVLDPIKLEKAIERARRWGIKPPIQVRRVADGYLLMDGLYRLRAAQAIGLEYIPAEVE